MEEKKDIGQEIDQEDMFEEEEVDQDALNRVIKETAESSEEEIEETPPQEAKKEETAAPDLGESVSSGQAGSEEAGQAEEAQKQAASSQAEEAQEQAASSQAEEAQEKAASSQQSEKKSGFFRKKEKKDPKDEKIEELSDRVRRQMAEFDNFRKRTEREKSQMFETGAKSVIEKILPVVDNFERGLASIPEEEKGSAVAEGMDKIYKQMMSLLEEIGVKPIEAVGKEFDPNLHNAVMHIEDENLGESVVAQEFQKGYMYRDTVVRHSMVQVAN